MKSEVKRGEVAEKPYPKLMEDDKLGIIVLFNTRGEGVVVNDSSPWYPWGYFGGTWNMSSFEDFHGSVTLSN